MRENNPLSGKPPANLFVAAVRVQLALAGVSAAEMARRINVPLSTFNRRMTGDSPFFASELVGIAAQLRIPASVLFEQAEASETARLDADVAAVGAA